MSKKLRNKFIVDMLECGSNMPKEKDDIKGAKIVMDALILYDNHVKSMCLEAFKQGMTFSHTEFSDTAYNRFRTWYSLTNNR